MEFELEDQFGNTFALRFPRPQVSVLTFGDWKGAFQVEGWVRPLYQRYRDRIDLRGVAVLEAVPPSFHAFARTQLRERIPYPVLLDFAGDVSRGYGYESNKANVVVIDTMGTIVLRVAGAANAEILDRIYAEIDRLID